MYLQSHDFFEKYEYFVLPVTQVEPFDITTEYPTTVAGVKMPTYIDWMRSCWYVTFMANPAISVPAGFSASGCRWGCRSWDGIAAEWSVLQMAHAFEQATRTPATVRPDRVASRLRSDCASACDAFWTSAAGLYDRNFIVIDPIDNLVLIWTITCAGSSEIQTRASPSRNMVDVLMIGWTTSVLHFFPAASMVSRPITLIVMGLLPGLK